jgi:photosystem II stability/assembly factor-like uncharacterized protein
MRKILLLVFFITSYWQINAQLKISTTATKLCDGTTIPLQATGIPANSTLQWQKDGVDIANANTANYSASTTGGYMAKALGKDAKWNRKSPDVDYVGLADVFFVNAKIGYAVGEASTIVKTTDGGITWKEQFSPGSGRLESVHFIDELNGWAVGQNGTVVRTTDGGVNWKDIRREVGVTNTDDFSNVQFIDSKVGFIVNILDKIYKTVDGGKTWTWNTTTNGNFELIFRTFFVDANIGFLTDFSGIIKKTVDGGKTWKEVYNISIKDPLSYYSYRLFTSIFFIDKNTGWAVGYDGALVTTNDGGNTWISKKGVNDGLYFHTILFTDTNNGVAMTYGPNFLQTTDGGKTWVLKKGNINSNTQATTFLDSKNGWSVGTEGIILKTTNGGTTWEKARGNTDNYGAITFVDKNIGYRVGGYGSIEKTTDGGNTWKAQNSTSERYLDKVQFADANTGWVSPNNFNNLLITNDGGNTWKNQVLNSPYSLRAIKLIDTKNGFAVGFGSRINRTTDGGVTWSQVKVLSDTNRVLNSISFVNNKIGWISGDRGILLKTIDGGVSWGQIKLDAKYTESSFESIFFYDDKNGWILNRRNSYDDTILKTIDGGITWKEYSTNYGGSSSIVFTDIKNGWLLNNGRGILLNTVDGGITWDDSQKSGTNKTLRSMVFLNAQTGWIVGDGNTILKYENSTLATSNTITINPKPAAPTVAWSNTDAKLTATSTSAGTLAWLKGTTDIPNVTTATYQPTSSGSYSVRVTDANGCAEVSKAIEVTILSSENPLNESGVNVYPNPSSNGIFKVAYTRFSNEMEASMQIIGLDGMPLNSQKMVRQNNVFEGEINASNLSTGIYFLQVVSGEQKAIVKISIAK